MTTTVSLSLLICLSIGPLRAEPVQDPGEYALVNVKLVPMDSERIVEGHALVVRAGVIDWVGPSGELRDDLRRVDGGGGYVMPGLTDAHVHVQHADELLAYLTSGVTTVMNLSGRPWHLDLRAAVARGERDGPAIFTAGPTIDGDPPRNPRFVPLGDPRDADALVVRQKEAGYDFLKLYDLLSPEAYAALTEAARDHGMAVAGHIPKAVGLEPVVKGQDLIAHTEEFFYTWFANGDDRARIPGAVALVVENGVAICPNTAFIGSVVEQAQDVQRVLARPSVRTLHPTVKQDWLPEGNRYVGREPSFLERNLRMHALIKDLTKALHDGGALLLTGTDASIAGAAPGFALLRELDELVECGLSPFEALRTVTVNPGQWIREHIDPTRRSGVIAPGNTADLLVLDQNALEDLGALHGVHAVIAAGRWHSGAELRARLDAQSKSYEQAWKLRDELTESLEVGDMTGVRALLAEHADGPFAYFFGEAELNTLGYGYLYGRGDPSTAIAILQLIVERSPESFNAYDSLGEAYMIAGEKRKAIWNYEKSLELNPNNAGGARMLERLREPPTPHELDETVEPPQVFTLSGPNGTTELRLDEPFEYGRGELTLTPSPVRRLELKSLSFEYPAFMGFEFERYSGLDTWTLDGNDTVVILQRFGVPVDEDSFMDDYVDGLIETLGGIDYERTAVHRKLGGETVGTAIQWSFGEIALRQEAFMIRAQGGIHVLLLQDSLDDDGSQSAEFEALVERIEASWRGPRSGK